MPYLVPQHPQVSKPDRRKAGRRRRFSRSARAARTPLVVASNCFASAAWRSFTRCHNSSSTIRSSGTSVLIHLLSGFGRDTRLPVLGSLMKRCRFQTSTPLVIDDAVAPAGVTPNRRVAPSAAERAGNAVPVQIGRDGARRFPHRKFPEDAADNCGLGLIDLAFAPNRLALAVGALYHVVAVAEPAARLALLHPAAQTTMGLGGEVLQEQGVHLWCGKGSIREL